MTKLYPNTIEGLSWGLQNFDGIETDIRLGKDDLAVLHHDAFTNNGDKIEYMDEDDCHSQNIPLFHEFLANEIVHQELSKGKTLWIEFKPNCNNRKPIKAEIADRLYQSFVDVVSKSNLPKSQIKVLSFAKELLEPVRLAQEYKPYPILPYVNECNNRGVILKGLTRLLMKSLKSHIEDAEKKGYGGILFARQYVVGPLARRHPSYSKLLKMIENTDIELGSNLGAVELEKDFPNFHRFSDKLQKYPRISGNPKAQIVAHRGTGTKGVEIL